MNDLAVLVMASRSVAREAALLPMPVEQNVGMAVDVAQRAAVPEPEPEPE